MGSIYSFSPVEREGETAMLEALRAKKEQTSQTDRYPGERKSDVHGFGFYRPGAGQSSEDFPSFNYYVEAFQTVISLPSLS